VASSPGASSMRDFPRPLWSRTISAWPSSPIRSRDPDDGHVLACELAAGTAVIVSGDRDLRTLRTFREIRILTAQDALAVLATRP